MKRTTSIILFTAAISAVGALGCKKSSSSEASTQTTEEVCEPVTFTSIPQSGRYIIVLNESTTTGRVIQSAEQVRVVTNQLFRKYDIADSQLDEVVNMAGKGFIAHLTAAQAAKMAADGEVKIVEPDRVIALGTGCFSVVAPSTAQWGVRRIGAGDGTGKRVWIVDTGVDTDHPDLLVDSTTSRSFVSSETYIEDNNGHGTHVAGIIGALNNSYGTLGVASGVTIIALKVLDGEGDGNTSNIIKALNYIGQNAKAGEVVNMSLGADTISQSLDNAVTTLANKGILFAIAAGNDKKEASLTSPARLNIANVYTVSAIDSTGKFATFSNFGAGVDYAAPGVNIVSTYSKGRYARLSGTSMAAPHLAGILILNGTAIKTKGAATSDPDGTPDPIASLY